ncbi:MAG: glycoside hydrolase family 3 C-terminal domain-containing protein [Marinagarivorans sp.]|nr:glycoside hydrolase family 3 C-terminal domain-containing protein [Marinagarivorans sp.]
MKHSFEEARAWAINLVQQMTLTEKCQYVGGTHGFYTHAIARLNLPSVLFSDATAGLVLNERFQQYTYQHTLKKTTAFPAPILLASTWNTELSEAYATCIGEQCNGNGVGVLLGPGFNLYRISQCGRNFEYFGEDPFLISRMVERYVAGVQSTGTIATLKHFVANNTDYFRRKSNSIVDERTLHEIYTPAFKAGIDAGALAIMTAYNLVNGEWASQSKTLIDHWLRGAFGFKGLVMTDWWAVYDSNELIHSGQDIEMPAADAMRPLQAKIECGEVAESVVDRMVTGILTTLKRMDLFDKKPTPFSEEQYTAHEAVALQTAREGIVLLRNQDNILPLNPEQKILALGDGMVQKALGGGSAFVKGYDQITQLDALKQQFANIHYDPVPTDDIIRNASCILLSINTKDREAYDHSFALDRGDDLYIQRILNLNNNVIVLMNCGGGKKMSHWIEQTKAVVYCWYNGQNGSLALAEILSGKTNPSGKLPITIEREFSDGPGANYIPEGEVIYSGENDAWEKARAIYDVNYDEGVFVGYRWYEKQDIKPLFPFGFGLSYSQFIFSNLRLSTQTLAQDQSLELTLTVTNNSAINGAEVVQVYIKNAPASEPRPLKELKGFRKVALKAHESREVTLRLKTDNFAYWSNTKKDWWAEAGDYEVLVGNSSEAILLSADIHVLN